MGREEDGRQGDRSRETGYRGQETRNRVVIQGKENGRQGTKT
jgi:hypothetical protein